MVAAGPPPAARHGRQTRTPYAERHAMLTTIALAAAEATATGSHMWEVILAVGTIALTIATVACTLVTAKLVRASGQEAATLANNSVDSMTDVALSALTHDERRRELARLNRRPAHATAIRTHRRTTHR